MLRALAVLLPCAAPAAAQVAPGPNLPAAGGQARIDYPLAALSWEWAQGGLGPVEVNESVGGPFAGDGGPLVMNQRTFRHGFGTHSTSVIAFDLGGHGAWFTSWVGVDDEVNAGGSVEFEVLGDGVSLYRSPLLRGWQPPISTGRVDVRGVHELLLVVHDGGNGRANDHADWGEPTVYAWTPPAGNGAALRARRGEWEAPLAWPVAPMHATLLPTGKLLTHAGRLPDMPGTNPPSDPHDSTRVDVADVATWSHVAVDHASEELFASGHARLSRGGLLALGGHGGRAANGRPFGQDQSSRFASQTAGWLPASPLVEARWGATALTLPSGGILALGGAHAGGNGFRPQAYDGSTWRSLTTATTAGWLAAGDPRLDDTFPMAHVAPDGRILWAGWGTELALLDTRGSGNWDLVAPREGTRRVFGVSAQTRPDEVLVLGGVDAPTSSLEAQRDGVRIDLSGAAPAVSPIAPMLFQRADADATLLADGTVLVSGGAEAHAEGDNPSAVRVPEIYDPTNDSWEIAAAARYPRAYRSSALLLQDARVWTGGGCGVGCGGSLTAEVFRPPYLFDGTGQPAARPVVSSAPTRVFYGEPFTLQVTGGAQIARVTLVRLGSATHGVNTDQRFLELSFTQGGSALQVAGPVNGNVAPPGPYMVFAFDAAGVPSVAPVVEVGPASPTAWETVTPTSGAPTPRHEAALVTVGGKLYLMGGRGLKPTEEYDPVTGAWRQLSPPPLELHHFQPVVHDGRVWVVGAMTGPYPNESNVATVRIWDPRTDTWTLGPPFPSGRARGGAGTVVYDDRIYIVGGNNQGHNGGARAWFDVLDPATGTWIQLPDAPHARDHFTVAVVANQLVVAGGRRTTQPNPFVNTEPAVDVFDLTAGTWRTLANDLPTERAGTMTVAVGQHVVVVGGESGGMTQAHDDVEALDVLTDEWLSLPPLVEDRHSGGLGVVDGRAYVVSGSGRAGGTPELASTERIDLARVLFGATSNLVANSGFDAGLLGWAGTGSMVLDERGGVAPPSLCVSSGWAATSVPASAGTTYELRAFVRVDGGSASSSVHLEFLDSSGNVIGGTSQSVGPVTELTTVRLTRTAPAGTVEARARFEATGSRTVVLDDVVVMAR